MKRMSATFLLCAVLAACGGSDDSPSAFDDARAAADSKESEATTLGVQGPCADSSQCGTLAFLTASAACGNYYYKPYSLVSATAEAASAAAAEQRKLAAQAQVLAPDSHIVCAAVVTPAPSLACQASTCQAL